MPKVDFGAKLEKDEKDHDVGGSKGNYYDFVVGENRFRVLTDLESFARHYVDNKYIVCIGIDKGCVFHTADSMKPSVKYAGYVWDKKDGKVKLATLPYSVMKDITALQKDEDWQFEGVPMPYDLKVTFDDKESPANMYKTKPSPQRDELPSAVFTDLANQITKISPEEFVQKMKDKVIKANGGVKIVNPLSAEDLELIEIDRNNRKLADLQAEAEAIDPDSINFE